ncbi:MAG: hypothetical protein JW776_02190 [Candidatus Lokiarchaeota archaeon]|nr:hypothetical protein [Candidatus Lokiarchaeota archaeon]
MVEIFPIQTVKIQPSQLYISEQKLQKIQNRLDSMKPMLEEPIPIKNLHGKTIFVDGHTRALALYLLDKKTIPVYWEYEELDWEAYEVCVQWCLDEGIHTVLDLLPRIVPHEEYVKLWYRRCDKLHHDLEMKRNNFTTPS